MAADLAPLLKLLAPTLHGADIGLQHGAGHIKAAVQNLGTTLNQAAHGVADVAGHTVTGAGQTVGRIPGAVGKTVHTIDHSHGVVGSADRAVFGH